VSDIKGIVLQDKAIPKKGEIHEYTICFIAFLCNVLFIAGSICFASSSDTVLAVGDWMYIVACIVNTYLSGKSYFEHAIEQAFKDNEEDDNEVNEEAMFFLSSIVFTVGCFCFMPGLPPTVANTFNQGLGAWFCIFGSFMLVFSCYYHALGMSEESVHESKQAKMTFKLSKLILALNLFGSVLFTVGSFMYRPSFGGQCPKGSSNAICISISSYGTSLYLTGSIIFTLASVFQFPIAIMKYHKMDVDAELAKQATESTPLQKSQTMA